MEETATEAGRKPNEAYSADLRLREDLGFDSLELAVLTAKIEADFGVDIFADGIVRTVGDIETKLARKDVPSDES